MPSVANLAVSVTARTQGFERGMRRSARSLQRFQERTTTAKLALRQLGSQLLTSPLGMAAGGFAAIGLGMRKALMAAEEFNQSMNQSLAIMGDVSDMMRRDMSRAAIEMARTTKFASKEIAASYYFLASAGLSAKQSLAALPVVVRFAQAGMFDLSTATDLLTDAQTAMGLTSDDATRNLQNMARVSDVLVKANTMANASVQQFSEALTTKAAAAARNIGMELEEVVSVLAVFADQGRKGAEGGTAFTIALRDMTEKALRNKRAFHEQGVTVFDLAGEFRGMADVVSDLENAFEGLTDAQRKQAFMDMGFTAKSMSATESLLGMSGRLRNVQEGLAEAMGETTRVSEKQLTTLQKGWADFSATFMGFITQTDIVNAALGETLKTISAILRAPEVTGTALGNLWARLFGGADELAESQRSLELMEALLANRAVEAAKAHDTEMRAMREQEAKQEQIAKAREAEAKAEYKLAEQRRGMLDDLGERLITLDMGAIDRAMRDLATLDAPKKFLDMARDIGDAIEQKEARIAIDGLIRGLQDQERATEMSRKELDLYTASMKGADEAQIRMIANTHDHIAALREQTDEERKSRAERERRLSLLDRPGEFREIRLERFHIPGVQAMNREQLVRDPQLAGVIREQQKTREVLERGVVAVAG